MRFLLSTIDRQRTGDGEEQMDDGLRQECFPEERQKVPHSILYRRRRAVTNGSPVDDVYCCNSANVLRLICLRSGIRL